jgi:sulfatase maturation enzyme AslB (radical SAM superfamily)
MVNTQSLGKLSPWAWALEPVRGCNLACWHCSARLLPKGQYQYMSEDTWKALWTIVRVATPRRRVEMAQMGEPTLHPAMLDFLRLARAISPQTQIQITTNGTQLIAGKVRYADLFAAGVNVMYVDMYHDAAHHIALAKESGVPFYEYLNPPPKALSPWTYYGPTFRLIVLMENPTNWPQRRKSLRGLGTFGNHLDWPVAEKHGLKPVLQPLHRVCIQPFKYVPVTYAGDFIFCCQDFMGETAGSLGNVNGGTAAFAKFWFGRAMQEARRALMTGNRAAISQCARCSMVYSTRGMGRFAEYWHQHDGTWWDGTQWLPL